MFSVCLTDRPIDFACRGCAAFFNPSGTTNTAERGTPMYSADLSKTFTFRLPSELADAMQVAARREMVSLSDLVRLALLKDLRSRGVDIGVERAA
jgi:hypothetical protein